MVKGLDCLLHIREVIPAVLNMSLFPGERHRLIEFCIAPIKMSENRLINHGTYHMSVAVLMGS